MDNQNNQTSLEDRAMTRPNILINNKIIHNFSLECSFIAQSMTFIGFYSSFSSPLLLIICLIGILLQETFFFRFIFPRFYQKDKKIGIKSVITTLRYSLLFYSIGNVLSIKNYQFNIPFFNENENDYIYNVINFDQIINIAFLIVSLYTIILMSYREVMFRTLVKLYDAYFKDNNEKLKLNKEYLKNRNYCVFNPYYHNLITKLDKS